MNEEIEEDISFKELQAVQFALENYVFPPFSNVIVHCDTMRVVFLWERDSGRCPKLMRLCKEFYLWVLKKQINLRLVYINTKDNLVDEPSRILDGGIRLHN